MQSKTHAYTQFDFKCTPIYIYNISDFSYKIMYLFI